MEVNQILVKVEPESKGGKTATGMLSLAPAPGLDTCLAYAVHTYEDAATGKLQIFYFAYGFTPQSGFIATFKSDFVHSELDLLFFNFINSNISHRTASFSERKKPLDVLRGLCFKLEAALTKHGQAGQDFPQIPGLRKVLLKPLESMGA